VTDACRLCGCSSETIQRLIASRPQPVQNTHMNKWPNFLRHEMTKKLHLLEKPYRPYYKYEQQVVLENDNYTLYCGLTLSTDKTFVFNRQDTTLVANKKRKLHSPPCSFPCTDITISYKNRLIHTYIINTSLLVLCHYEMFRPSKGHLQGARLIHCCENISVVLPEDGSSMAETWQKDTILTYLC
jgi:hypothetical protein